RSTGTPWSGSNPANCDAHVAHRVGVHLQGHRRRGEGEGKGFAISYLVVSRSTAQRGCRHTNPQDELGGVQGGFNVRRRARPAVQFLGRDRSFPRGPEDTPLGMEGGERARPAARINGDARFAPAEQCVPTVYAFFGGAAASRLAFFAGERPPA